ncbi:hypothetical protein C8F01DRAFT_1113311, partial [Mycena amicta]
MASKHDQVKPSRKIKNRRSPLLPLSEDITSRYPPELHDYVIDFLHDHRPSLCSCSLVCTSWFTTSRYHLFRNSSTLYVYRANLRSFLEMHASGRLNPYIGRLNLESHVIDERSVQGEDTFQFNHDLSRFTRLSALSYLRLHYHHDDVAPSFFSAIAQNFSSITELELSSVHINSFARVYLRGDQEQQEALTETTTYPVLDHLADFIIDCNWRIDHILRWLAAQPSIRLVAIEKLSTPSEMHLFTEAIRAIGPRLEHLILGRTLTVPDLSCAVRLRVLELRQIAFKDQPTRFPPKDPNYVSQVLAPILVRESPPITIQHIGLTLYNVYPSDIHELSWERIAPLLAGATSLQRVQIDVSSHKRVVERVVCDEKLPPPRPYSLKVQNLDYRWAVFSLVDCCSK